MEFETVLIHQRSLRPINKYLDTIAQHVLHRFGGTSVHNDEIISLEATRTAQSDAWGYVPTSTNGEKWTIFSIGIFDLAAIDADGVTVFAGGDLSSQPYSSGWGTQYLDETELALRIENHGWISSPVNNLATTEHGSASMWMEPTGSEPASTSIGFQYRVANSEAGLASETWKPSIQSIQQCSTSWH